jgi:hypothetical protein
MENNWGGGRRQSAVPEITPVVLNEPCSKSPGPVAPGLLAKC